MRGGTTYLLEIVSNKSVWPIRTRYAVCSVCICGASTCAMKLYTATRHMPNTCTHSVEKSLPRTRLKIGWNVTWEYLIQNLQSDFIRYHKSSSEKSSSHVWSRACFYPLSWLCKYSSYRPIWLLHTRTHTHEWFLQTNVVVSTSAIDCLQRLICLQNDLLSVECDVKPCSVCRSLKFSPPFYCMTVFKFSIEMIF